MTITPSGASAPNAQPPSPPAPAPVARKGRLRGLAKAALAIAACAGIGYAVWKYPEEARRAWEFVAGGEHGKPARAPAAPSPGPQGPWNGRVALTEKARDAIGVMTAEVRAQEEPIRLELLGTTEYISDTLSKVRPMFKGRVDKVHVSAGHAVKKGDPLVDLYSKELAEAKSTYEIERIQWLYDKNLLEKRESLVKTNAISQQLYDETKNNEMKNRQEYQVARDRLLVYGLGEREVDRVPEESGAQKARLTLRSPIDGLVIERDVVAGNLYDENDTLLVIAPLDRLWVWGNVFESDLDLVEIGQAWEIQFPFLRHKIPGKVEYISNRVDPGSHAVRIRTSIPNVGGKLKSDMLVRGLLEIPPVAGRVVIPRTALVVADGHFYAFVEAKGAPGEFERRSLAVVQEKDDRAVVELGLEAGEKVATVGALILAQIYEDLETTRTGAPANPGPEEGGNSELNEAGTVAGGAAAGSPVPG
jgi:cobalt-zinc-cadmium efflux system membrane fusion protein